MTLDDLKRRATPEITPEEFPEHLNINGNRLALAYKFEPGAEDDGATLTVPQPLLTTLNAESLAWAIPGWHLKKFIAMLRALPKELRKHFVPVPEAATRALRETHPLSHAAFAAWITRESGQTMSAETLAQISLPEHLRINVRVVRLDGTLIAQGRDLLALRRAAQRERVNIDAEDATLHRGWDFGELPVQRAVQRRGVQFTVYPAIKDASDGVELVECGSLREAEALTRAGIMRLAVLALSQQAKYVQKEFTDHRELVLLSQGFANPRELAQQFVDRIFDECFAIDELPRTQAEFERLLHDGRGRIGDTANRVLAHCVEIFKTLRAIRQLLATLTAPQYRLALAEIQQQLARLAPASFLAATPAEWFAHLPRYLRALQRRLERLPTNIKRDAELMKQVAPFTQAETELAGKLPVQPELTKLRWMIEEFRVSLFAQDLKTSLPVSDKRLEQQVQRAREETTKLT